MTEHSPINRPTVASVGAGAPKATRASSLEWDSKSEGQSGEGSKAP